jgi:hypothetical protein
MTPSMRMAVDARRGPCGVRGVAGAEADGGSGAATEPWADGGAVGAAGAGG